ACSPVPEPKVKGKGHDIVYVTLVTNQTYNPAGISTFMSDFSETKIQQYSASVGNFSDLNCTNTDGYFTWTFKLTDANCSIVNAWVKQIVASSSFYKTGYTSCGSETFTAYVTLVTRLTYGPSECSLMNRINRTPIFCVTWNWRLFRSEVYRCERPFSRDLHTSERQLHQGEDVC
ncbi:hypothetical protein V3C99_000256, partial [Haemonchus contortus]